MRRLLALVALLAITWPHVVVMRCAAVPHASRGHEASMIADHAHEGSDCPALMACGSAMVEGTIDESVAEPATPPTLHEAVPTTPPSTADLSADPPPPRRLA